MVKIRLRRMGATKRPSYRIVVAEAWGPRDGDFLETLGHYNPLTSPATVVLNQERLQAWLQKGAQPSEAVARILKRQGIALPEHALAVISTNRAAARGAAAPKVEPAATSRRGAAAAATAAPAAAVATAAVSATAEAAAPEASAPEPNAAPVEEAPAEAEAPAEEPAGEAEAEEATKEAAETTGESTEKEK